MLLSMLQGKEPKKPKDQIRFSMKLGNQNRVVRVINTEDEPEIQLLDTVAEGKRITLPLCRWEMLTSQVEAVQETVRKLEEEQQFDKLHVHLGGNVFLSVSPGIYCVDVRKHFTPHSQDAEEPKPTRMGRTMSHITRMHIRVQYNAR